MASACAPRPECSTSTDTIAKFNLDAGDACAALHDALVRDLRPTFIEADEVWTFVQKKQKRVRQDDPVEYGDTYLFTAIDANTKLMISYVAGKRNRRTTEAFIADLRARVLGRPQISTDKFGAYPDAIALHFGADVDYGTVEKQYTAPMEAEAARRYSPSTIRSVTREVVLGEPNPAYISTSYVERSNLSLRTHLRRFTRLALGFSKRARNLNAAVALYMAWYNFCRVHETLRVTPAMEAGLTDHVWSLAELLDIALNKRFPAPPTAPEAPRGMSAGRAKAQLGRVPGPTVRKSRAISDPSGSASSRAGSRGWPRLMVSLACFRQNQPVPPRRYCPN